MNIKNPIVKIKKAITLFLQVRRMNKKKKKDEQDLQKYLEDPVNRLRIAETAKLFNQIFQGKWFTITQVLSSTQYKTTQDALRILYLLKLSKNLIAEERGEREVYRISLNETHRIELLKRQQVKLQKQLSEVIEELKAVK